MNAAPLLPPPAPVPRAATIAGLALVVLFAHAWLLASLPRGLLDANPESAVVMKTRQVIVEVPPPADAPPPPRPAPRPAPPRPAPSRAAAPAAEPPPLAEPVPTAADAPAPEIAAPGNPVSDLQVHVPVPLPEEAASAPLAAASAPAVAEAAVAVALAASLPAVARAGGGEAPPPTRLPPATTLHYELHRGLVSGQGVLVWKPDPEGYQMTLEGQALGFSVLNWDSLGGFDEAGIAPRRFVDRRRGRDARAANFERDKGRISWSGNEPERPLVAGAQDRLSWMVQLAALVEADPARFVRGERAAMWVAGARGDADLWTFTVTGREPVELIGGSRLADSLVLRREPRKAYDTQVEVWLDPGRHHLPARMRLTTLPSGDALEFVLRP